MFEGILLNIVSILHYVHFHANIAGELPRLDRVPPYGGGPWVQPAGLAPPPPLCGAPRPPHPHGPTLRAGQNPALSLRGVRAISLRCVRAISPLPSMVHPWSSRCRTRSSRWRPAASAVGRRGPAARAGIRATPCGPGPRRNPALALRGGRASLRGVARPSRVLPSPSRGSRVLLLVSVSFHGPARSRPSISGPPFPPGCRRLRLTLLVPPVYLPCCPLISLPPSLVSSIFISVSVPDLYQRLSDSPRRHPSCSLAQGTWPKFHLCPDTLEGAVGFRASSSHRVRSPVLVASEAMQRRPSHWTLRARYSRPTWPSTLSSTRTSMLSSKPAPLPPVGPAAPLTRTGGRMRRTRSCTHCVCFVLIGCAPESVLPALKQHTTLTGVISYMPVIFPAKPSRTTLLLHGNGLNHTTLSRHCNKEEKTCDRILHWLCNLLFTS